MSSRQHDIQAEQMRTNQHGASTSAPVEDWEGMAGECLLVENACFLRKAKHQSFLRGLRPGENGRRTGLGAGKQPLALIDELLLVGENERLYA